eukprot:TRINITY_DN13691_c0_g1_i1.p1 TRINITY_DN13691_c0_g1~~TRINITY_DN13691_c0_g1_i1.p1  ORF type:complete len:336 (-),score=61.44 TRINITY_DN13691_c0_g1_i1:230-1210(-)
MVAAMTSLVMDWWKSLEVNLVAVYLAGPLLVSLSSCCRAVHANLRSKGTLQWLADLRGLGPGIKSLEQLELAEAMSALSSSVFFGWGSMEVSESAIPSLERIAQLLDRHQALVLSIEAHCGLEARFHMPMPGEAREYTSYRAGAVRVALEEVAERRGKPLDPKRICTKAWGCSQPVAWAFRAQGYGQACDPCAAARNRRVELYLRSGDFEVPKRRRPSEIPLPPGAEPVVDDGGEEDDPAAAELRQDRALAQLPSFTTVQTTNNSQLTVPTALLRGGPDVLTGRDTSSSESEAEDSEIDEVRAQFTTADDHSQAQEMLASAGGYSR